ncbi:MAG: hypothetical protein ACKPBU_01790 [Alphaproteobacteria bacterium]
MTDRARSEGTRSIPRGVRRGAFHAAVLAAATCVGLAPAGCAARSAPSCNPYFPVAKGATWAYRDLRRNGGTSVERRVAVESVERDDQVVTAVLSQDVETGGASSGGKGGGRTILRCSGGAVATSVEGAATTPSGASARVRAELPGFPAADRLVAGYEWKSEGRIETRDGYDRSTTAIRRESRVDGFFPVDTSAGRFPSALRVSSVETLRTGDGPRAREARQEVREWYVRGIGLVKRDTRLADATGKEQAASAEELVRFEGLRADP